MPADTTDAIDHVSPDPTPSSGIRRVVLRLALWVLSTPMILVLASILITAGAFILSYTLDQWHWFPRFGALSVSLGAMLSTRRILRIGIQGLLMGENYFVIAQRERQVSDGGNFETQCDLMCSYFGFWVVAFGTLIWAFGDLVGYFL